MNTSLLNNCKCFVESSMTNDKLSMRNLILSKKSLCHSSCLIASVGTVKKNSYLKRMICLKNDNFSR